MRLDKQSCHAKPIPARDFAETDIRILWLAALVGGVVGAFLSRNFFESEKKLTELIKLPFGVDDPQFERTVSNLIGQPLIGGNGVEILQNGDEIIAAGFHVHLSKPADTLKLLTLVATLVGRTGDLTPLAAFMRPL